MSKERQKVHHQEELLMVMLFVMHCFLLLLLLVQTLDLHWLVLSFWSRYLLFLDLDS